MNPKAQGEKGQRIAIGELAKWDLDVAIPLTDNLPWDFIIVYDGKLFKAQVKSSLYSAKTVEGSIQFDLRSSNWHKKTWKKYQETDCDVMVLCDYENVYLLTPDQFGGRSTIAIRKTASRNGQKKDVNLHDDLVLSKKRIRDVLG